MKPVYFKSSTYAGSDLKPAVFGLMEKCGGREIAPGAKVLIKPNFLLPAKPESAILTHPGIVAAACEYALARGARVLVADSPATGSFARLIKKGGYELALRGMDVEIRPFKETAVVDIGEPFGKIALAKDAMEADVVINLAKLKSHSQMLLTLGVKNMFGCVVGFQKPQWHLRSGVDRDWFARLLVQIHYTVNPAITLVDGIWSLEGDGPGKGGRPRPTGVLVGGRDAAAVDVAVCRLLKLDPEKLPTCRAARARGLITGDEDIRGDFKTVDDFILPDQGAVAFGPAFLKGFIRAHVLQKPVVDPDKCRSCGECWTYCPAEAVFEQEAGVAFNYGSCIRCYCCVEVCPHGALAAKMPKAGRVLEKIGLIKQRSH
jgi:uncharacterized protein (DUF362 family)/Pyruvate/2-oxoacid:ferredoxin oxidoreductase delta subunit